MKIFHRKFLESAPPINDPQVPEVKTNTNYFVNQFIVWILIFLVIFFLVQFFKWTTNFN